MSSNLVDTFCSPVDLMFMDSWKRQNWGDIRKVDLIGVVIVVKPEYGIWKPIQLVSLNRFN